MMLCSRRYRTASRHSSLADDLKRTDFTAGHKYSEKEACSSEFLDRFISTCRAASPFTKFLTDALGLPY